MAIRAVVAGALANKPGYGGEAWVRMAWVRGLEALGLEVLFVEQVGAGGPPEGGEDFFRAVTGRFGLEGAAALLDATGRVRVGPGAEELRDRISGADLLVNLSGNLTDPGILASVGRRVYVDLDPGYTQFWHADGVGDLRLEDHDLHLTVGTAVGTARCAVPTGDIRWRPVRRPVVLEDWPVADPVDELRLTTVASWRGAYGAAEHGGVRYRLKAHEFRALADLPAGSPHLFEIALDIHEADAADRRLLEEGGWILKDPREAAGTPDAFRSWVARSAAEISPAQGIYVATRSGWFSDRSARYLAAGRPVIVQDTGFRESLPVGEGILTFRTPAEASAAVEALARDRSRHERGARRIAEEYLDARVVLAGVLEEALGSGWTGGVPVTGVRFAPAVAPDDGAPGGRADGSAEQAGPPAPAPGARGTGSGGARGIGCVVVSGMFAGVPGHGGATWAALQYVLGLRALGHRVLVVEEMEGEDAVRPSGAELGESRNAAQLRALARDLDLEGSVGLHHRGTGEVVGLDRRDLLEALDGDAVLLNLSGTLRAPQLLEAIPVRVYVDLDPAFTQVWHHEGHDVGLEGHTHFATVGLEVGGPEWRLPDAGVSWIPLLPPVALERWTPGAAVRHVAFTTVANWRGYGSVCWDGVRYGQKAHSFRQLMELPRRVPEERFAPALGIHEDERADRDALRENGWILLDPGDEAGDPERYRQFVRGSMAEIGVAKEGYVRARTGWFSDRSACYLASGRPVLAQDTGFGRHLPTGRGLLAFSDVGEAAEGARAIRRDYRAHARAAAELAREHLDAGRVLSGLLERVT